MGSQEVNDERLIRGFFEGDLSSSEKELFDKRMENKAFSDSVAERTARIYSQDKLRGELKEMGAKLSNKWQGNNWRTIAAVSIASIMTLGIVILLNIGEGKADSQDLYAGYFEPAPNIFKNRSEADSVGRGEWMEAMNLYEVANYSRAVELFRNLRSKEPDASVDYYLSISLMANGQESEAIPILENRIREGTPILEKEMRWYLALAYLKLGRKEEATTILKEIELNSSELIRADKLLEDLR